MCRGSDANKASSHFVLCNWPPAPRLLLSGHSHNKHLQDVALSGIVRRGISISGKGKGVRKDNAEWKELSSGVLFGFNCFCSFTLALSTKLEVWHFKVSFYRNKCQERWVILISLKINPGCQRNQNFALELSQRESKRRPAVGCAAAWGNPQI